MPTDKPYFKCPFELKQRRDGVREFHVTRRDGTIEIIPAPPDLTHITSNIEVFQPEGSDQVEIGFFGGRSTSRMHSHPVRSL